MLVRRLLRWCLALFSVGGCWSEERIGGVFTEDQLERLREQFTLPPPPDACVVSADGSGTRTFPTASTCATAQRFGQALFFDRALAKSGTIACSDCHVPSHWFADPRPLSAGATKPTGRHTISIVNIAYKPPGTFTWVGLATPAGVITDIALPNAMATGPKDVARAIWANPAYLDTYRELFGDMPPIVDDAPDEMYEGVAHDVALAFEAYMRQLTSFDTPFDRFIAGDYTAMTEAQIRGFGVFVGQGLCVECHSGPLFSNHQFKNTGVKLRVEPPETGWMGTGAFYTAPLRDIAKTPPYMHDGSQWTLAEVVEFYRRGGDENGHAKSNFVEELTEMTDEDAHDLVEFMHALSGPPIEAELSRP